MVSNAFEGAQESRRRNDPEETSNVHHDIRTPRIFRTEHATGKNELHWKEPRPHHEQCCESRWRKCYVMGNDFDYHFWNDECLLDLIA